MEVPFMRISAHTDCKLQSGCFGMEDYPLQRSPGKLDMRIQTSSPRRSVPCMGFRPRHIKRMSEWIENSLSGDCLLGQRPIKYALVSIN